MCDTIVAVSEEGVFFGKNSGRDANEAQLLEWRPRKRYPAGRKLRCTWVEIDQVEESFATLLSRPYWTWGAEIGTNEYGVTIGNEAVFTTEPYAKTGLTGMDLIRLALERSATAKEAVQTILELLERYGQGGGCGHESDGFSYHNSFIIADPVGAFVLETAGKHHAIEDVRGSRSISNGLTIEPFASQHAHRPSNYVAACKARQAETSAAIQGARSLPPFLAALRGHGAGRAWPRFSWLNGAMNPCMHGGGLAVSSVTCASWVSHLRPDGCQHWVTGTSSPCLSLYKPVDVHTPVSIGCPTDREDPASLWWAHERLHRLVLRDPERLAETFLEERNDVQTAWFEQPPASEAAFVQARALIEKWTLCVQQAIEAEPRDLRPWWARRYWNKRERRAAEGPSCRREWADASAEI